VVIPAEEAEATPVLAINDLFVKFYIISKFLKIFIIFYINTKVITIYGLI